MLALMLDISTMFNIFIGISLFFVHSTVGSSDISPIRLVDGPTTFEGRLEVYHDSQWGSVCDDGIGMDVAEVVCRQLGHEPVTYKKEAFYGESTGPIMLDNVFCYGNESALTECMNNGWYDHNCFHHEDAGFICEWDDFTVRIHQDSGRRVVAGRVEIYYNDTWNTVCNPYASHWDINNADVVCKQVGFATAATMIKTTNIEPASGPVLLSDVECTGEEDSIMECSHLGLYNNSCNYDNPRFDGGDAGVLCLENVDDYDLRLVDNKINDDFYNRGVTQIYINGSWGMVCDSWNYVETKGVICRQLGYEDSDGVVEIITANEVGPFVIHDIVCKGDEKRLIDCTYTLTPDSRCTRVGFVSCLGPRVRLRGGQIPSEGRVEVLHHGQWGTICGTDDDFTTADLICDQLGYRSVIEYSHGGNDDDNDDLPIMLSGVDCSPYNDYLSECKHNGWFIHNCDHSQDLRVTCDPGPVYRVRIVDGTNTGSGSSIAFEGRVELFVEGKWGIVCDTNWDKTNADVVCKELGFSRALQATDGDYFGEAEGRPFLMDNVTCSENHEHLSHCQHSGWYQYGDGCNSRTVAGVICDPGLFSPVRLYNTVEDKYMGNVEMFHRNSWQTICTSEWTFESASVICRELFHNERHFMYGRIAQPSNGADHFQLVSCGGWEYSLTDCEHNGWYYCTEDMVPDVTCDPPETDEREGAIRLVDGTRASEGRVEYYHNGVWDSICDSDWDHSDAQVVCRQLGYPHTFRASTGSEFGYGSGVIHVESVNCVGTEERLEDCFLHDWGGDDCDVTKEAGVVCGVEDGTLRLADGKNKYEGRIEIHHQGVWGTICDALWGLTDAQVACRQLGYGDALDVYYGAYHGPGSGPVLLDYVSCYGFETRIDECPRGGWYDTDCDHTRDAGIRCENPNDTNPGDSESFTNISLILGLVLATLCVLLWCYKPCCKFIKKRRQNNDPNNRALNEIVYPRSGFDDFEIVPGNDLPTYQDAAADVPPSYDHLYGEAPPESDNQGGVENRGRINSNDSENSTETENNQTAIIPETDDTTENTVVPDSPLITRSRASTLDSRSDEGESTPPNESGSSQLQTETITNGLPDIVQNIDHANVLPAADGQSDGEDVNNLNEPSGTHEDAIPKSSVVMAINEAATEITLAGKTGGSPIRQLSLPDAGV